MKSLHNHIVLMGFKNTGKSIIGENLAKTLAVPFMDLDKVTELFYEKKCNEKLTCRKIMQKEGAQFFRHLETQALLHVISEKPSIISLGGGTPLSFENQRLIKPYLLVHIMAPKGIVYERIAMNGHPAFVSPEEDLFESFNRLWDERIGIYEKIKDFSILNDSTVQESIKKITQRLNLEERS